MTEPAAESIPSIHERDAPPAAAPVARPRRRSAAWLVAAALVVAVIGWRVLQPSAAPPAGKPADAPRPIPVSVAAAAVGDLDVTLSGLGTVTPLATVSVKSEISGKLVEIAYKEGQMVEQGDFLAEIDPRPYQNALRQAQGQLMRDQALLDNARLDLDRYRRLVKQDSAPRQQLDTQDALVRQYEGTVEIDQAQVDNAKLNLDYCRIKAPVSGRVGLRLVDLGNYVTSGDANGVVVIAQLQPISVVFPVAEDHLPVVMKQIAAGKKLPVEAYDRGGGALLAKGFLATVDNEVDPTTGTVKFKAQFDNADLALFPNQFVNARLLVDTLRGATAIPAAAIQYGPAGPFVYVVGDDGAAAMRLVALGPADGDKIAIRSGLAPGARVVTEGADRLRDGSKARVLEQKAAAEEPAEAVRGRSPR